MLNILLKNEYILKNAKKEKKKPPLERNKHNFDKYTDSL